MLFGDFGNNWAKIVAEFWMVFSPVSRS